MPRKPPPPDDDPDDSIPRIGLAAKKKKEDEVPKIPRGKLGFGIPPGKQIFVIGMTLITLIVVITMSRRCGEGVGKVFKSMEPPDAGATIYVPAPPLPPEERPPVETTPPPPAPDPTVPPSAAPPGEPYKTPVPPNSPADPGTTKPRVRPATPSR